MFAMNMLLRAPFAYPAESRVSGSIDARLMRSVRRAMQCALMGTLALTLQGCAGLFRQDDVPTLHLTPASLGHELSVRQRMDVEAHGGVRSFEAVLEVDQDEVRLAVLQLGQTIARLVWDGRTLTQSLAPGWPAIVSADHVLSDLQYVWWPQDQLQAALPSGWALRQSSGSRELWHGDNLVLEIRTVLPGVLELIQHDRAYLVRLHTQGTQPDFATP